MRYRDYTIAKAESLEISLRKILSAIRVQNYQEAYENVTKSEDIIQEIKSTLQKEKQD